MSFSKVWFSDASNP